MTPTLNIDVHFDLICPWCMIGKRHLATALAEFTARHPEVPLKLSWHGQELLPDTPPAGLPYQEFYVQRLGSPAAVAARRAQVREAAMGAGLSLNFAAIERLPNTRAALALIEDTRQTGSTEQVEALLERLYTAYFVEGRDIGQPAVLAELAAACGIADDDAPAAPLPARAVPGVPYFVFNERSALSGAQPPAILLQAMEEALASLR